MNTLTFSKKILNKLELKIGINKNPYSFKIEEILDFGARVNPKRSFLFISKLLGKHLEVNPNVPKISGYLLADLYANKRQIASNINTKVLVQAIKTNTFNDADKELKKTISLDESTLFLGLAETATGLGYATALAFDNAIFVHTTREEFKNEDSAFDFKEEHSHATKHLCYPTSFNKDIFNKIDRMVLVDDEITTGKTCLNLIKSIKSKYQINKFTLLTIFDWRTDKWISFAENFARENQIELEVIAIIHGDIKEITPYVFTEETTDTTYDNYPIIPKVYEEPVDSFSMFGKITKKTKQNKIRTYCYDSGRFGLSSFFANKDEEYYKKIGEDLSKRRKCEKTLVLGCGEFIYIPSIIATGMGEGVVFKSTTRSPIYISSDVDYPINNRIAFNDEDVKYYAYNMDKYNEIFIISDWILNFDTKHKIIEQLARFNVGYVHFFSMTGGKYFE